MESFKQYYIGVIRQMSRGFLSTFLIIFLISISCTYDQNPLNTTKVDCNVQNLKSISYSRDVFPIIQSNCLSCHDAVNHFDGVVIENYQQISESCRLGEMMDVITTHYAGSLPRMPKGGQLKSCEVEVIRLWIQQGLINN